MQNNNMNQNFYTSTSSRTTNFYCSNTAANTIQLYGNVEQLEKKGDYLLYPSIHQYPPITNISLFINYVRLYRYNNIGSNTISTYVSEELDYPDSALNYTFFPLFWTERNTIKVPKKVVYTVTRLIPKKVLKTIHPDLNIAYDLCMLFTTQLTSTYFEMLKGDNLLCWKSLRAEYLRDLLFIETDTYKQVRMALEYLFNNGSIIECDYNKIIGSKCYNYRLGEAFIGKGIEVYTLKTEAVKSLLNKHLTRAYNSALINPICKNLIAFYPQLTLPTIDEIKLEAKRLISLNYHTKKGKKLVFLNKHPKHYYKHPETLSFVEDSIEHFEYLTDNVLIIPTVGTDPSGGRIVDSFTLMPSWIRKLILVNGKQMVECDYTCLHPNIAMNLYGGSMEFIKHLDVALKLNIDIQVVKTEHLSFFNKEVWQMKLSPLYNYYLQEEPIMMERIISEKHTHSLKHKATSKMMFTKEVEIMTAVIEKLNTEGIYVGYIYDALFFNPQFSKRVKQVMDETILLLNIKTDAKLSITLSETNQITYKPSLPTPYDQMNNALPMLNTNNYFNQQFLITQAC